MDARSQLFIPGVLISVMFVAASFIDSAVAAPVTVINASFESQVIADGTFATSSAPMGWAVFGNLNLNNRTVGVLNPNSTTLYSGGATDGNNVGVIFLLDDFGNQSTFAGSEGGMQQTLTDTLQSWTRYTLTIDVGNIANEVNFPHNQFAFGGFPGYRIDLLAGSNVIASDNNTLLPAEGMFSTSTIEFTTDNSVAPGQQLGIRLVNLNQAIGIEVNFDNVRLDATAVPEPSTGLACLLVGLLLGFKRRTRKKTDAHWGR